MVVCLQNVPADINKGKVKFWVFLFQIVQIAPCKLDLFHLSIASFAHVIINKQVKSTCCLLSFINLQLVIPGRTWILL